MQKVWWFYIAPQKPAHLENGTSQWVNECLGRTDAEGIMLSGLPKKSSNHHLIGTLLNMFFASLLLLP
ncbi:hypothetical protein ACFSMW_07670 [Virgibacillus halophilus]